MEEADGTAYVGPKNGVRLATDYALDLRATWRKPLARGVFSFSAAMINALNEHNPCCAALAVRQTRQGRPQLYVKRAADLPALPWLSLSWDF